MKFEKNVVAIFILALVTAILLALVFSQATARKVGEDKDAYYGKVIEDMKAADEVYKKEITELVNNLSNSLKDLQVEKEVFIETNKGYNVSEVNQMMLDLANRMLQHDSESYAQWLNQTQTLLDDAYRNGRSSKSSRTYIINPGPAY